MSAPAARRARWMLRGAVSALSLPALVLMAAQVGFAALARDAGLTLTQTVFLTLSVWALPSQVVFVGLVGSGASMPAVALAVGLSAVRFMPMVMAWTPVVRGHATPRWLLLLLSWFVAITAWVFAMARLPGLERAARVPFFAGFAVTLTALNGAIVAIAYSAIGALPAAVAAMLVFLTPIYFLLALWGAARDRADRLALLAGLALGPLFTALVPEADLVLAGLLGGTLAYLAGRAGRRREAR